MKLCIRWFLFFAAGAAAVILATPRYLDWRDAREAAARVVEEARQKKVHDLLEMPPRRMEDLPSKYHAAAKIVSEVLRAERESPDEFRVVVEEDGKALIFHLWHLSAFEVKREAVARGLSVIGNPGGRCKSIEFDTLSQRASPSRFWQ